MKTSIVIKSLFICGTLAAAATYALINKEDASAPELSNHQIIDNETIDLSGYWDNASLSHLLSDRLWFGAESEADNGMISFWSHSDEGVNKPVVMTWNDQQIFTGGGSEAPDESKETAEEGAKEPVTAKPVSVPAPSPLILLSLCVSALLMKNHWARRSQTA